MSDCGEDDEACVRIAEAKEVGRSDWESAKKGWSELMANPSDMGKTALAFMPLYKAALESKNGSGEPCSLEEYARIHSQISFRKDPDDKSKQINFEVVLKENNLTVNKWGEYNSYWTPKVTVPGETHQQFATLIQKFSDEIMGIKR